MQVADVAYERQVLPYQQQMECLNAERWHGSLQVLPADKVG
jgi:hypothetical protein